MLVDRPFELDKKLYLIIISAEGGGTGRDE
jgi:hypothetical protein